MTLDTLKTGFTYVIALVVLVGSGALLMIVPSGRFEQLLPFVTAVDGAVIAYVFAREQTQIVQAGNGIERQRLENLESRVIDTLTAQVPRPPSSVAADHVDVEGEHVSVTGGGRA